MLVYRLEDDMGVGAFFCDADWDYDDARLVGPKCNSHPGPRDSRERGTPLNEAFMSTIDDYHFCFTTLDHC